MKKSYFEKRMEILSKERENHIQKLWKLPCDKLYEMKFFYFDLYTNARDLSYHEAEQVNYFKYEIVEKALEIKRGINTEV